MMTARVTKLIIWKLQKGERDRMELQ
ncbi:unnamed protein product, partial [Allacma fusca]